MRERGASCVSVCFVSVLSFSRNLSIFFVSEKAIMSLSVVLRRKADDRFLSGTSMKRNPLSPWLVDETSHLSLSVVSLRSLSLCGSTGIGR
ncbi:hypothetical protein Bca52824_028307 [Brassica carinata]|uniref:Uncharacterized protein n=1 Tax=Brassica carinata TaxID=52824 RepID=A0A8X8AML9_BRACI|nr:hypothetical protein Bca52824_028307 [Brassica carinata]